MNDVIYNPSQHRYGNDDNNYLSCQWWEIPGPCAIDQYRRKDACPFSFLFSFLPVIFHFYKRFLCWKQHLIVWKWWLLLPLIHLSISYLPSILIDLCLWNDFLVIERYTYSLFFVSIHIVTGPSFNNSTFMSAPNSPVPIGFPNAISSWWQNSLYKGMECSWCPALSHDGRFPFL